MAHHPRLSPAVWRGDSYDGFILGFICGSIVFAVSIGGISFLTDPEAFALAAPEHFDYIIEAIQRAKAN